MNLFSFGLILTGVLLNAAAQLLLKAGTNQLGVISFTRDNIFSLGWQIGTQPHIFGGLTCYVISVVVWIMALSRVEVSIAYPMLSIGYVVNAIAAWWLFGEALSMMRMSGIGVIVVGVYIVARS